MKTLSGFRDLLPSDYARRRYVVDHWRETARCYGFMEFDGPMLESAELYQKKNSGGEILTQLYQFTDRGERDVALRPEMTPTLARIVAMHHREFVKPLRWFNAGSCFRYERQQRGRLREFLQFNADLLGESSPAADAEIIALLIDLLKSFGFGPGDVVIRISDRLAWQHFLESHQISSEQMPAFLGIIDKMEREPEDKTSEKLTAFNAPTLTVTALKEFMLSSSIPVLSPLLADLSARGLREFVKPDLSIVRGLAYYTGVVFEAFALRGGLRAVAGGGRYDRLIHDLSDGAANLPAVGFGMGDAVLLELIKECPHAAAQEEAAMKADPACHVYFVIAEETRRNEALQAAQQLRNAGIRTSFSLSAERIGKQFSAAENTNALFAVIVGAEWPQLKIKRLSTREEIVLPQEALLEWVKAAIANGNSHY
ncbi:MAG: histidine--tRNA ligase [Chthoniobacterales bacterium]